MQRRAAKIYLFFLRLFHIIHCVFDNYLMYFQNKAYMEAIKFSELPTGDRMPLADEDGVPIIASQENRLLTWGRLKKQLAEQTHTDTVKPSDTKVPTSSAVENRIAATEDDFNDKLTPITAKLDTHDTAIETATATANTAKTTAESASATASEAKTTAEGAASSIGAVSQRVGAIETKIENGEFDAPEVDLSPITERLSAVETSANSANTTAETAQARANAAISAATAQDFALWQLTQLAQPSADELVTKEILEKPNTGFSESLVYFNNNFSALTSLINKLHSDTSDLKDRFYITKITTTTDEDGTENTTSVTMPLDQYVQEYENRIETLEAEMTAWTSDIKLLIGQLADNLQGLNS